MKRLFSERFNFYFVTCVNSSDEKNMFRLTLGFFLTSALVLLA